VEVLKSLDSAFVGSRLTCMAHILHLAGMPQSHVHTGCLASTT